MKSWWQLVFGILSGLLGAAVIVLFTSQPRGEPVTILPPPTPAPIQVHVTGAVVNPDVFSLPAHSRVQDAIEAAGGFLPDAYTTSLNLAKELKDGDKVLVPFTPEEGYILDTGENPPAEAQEPEFPININTASKKDLERLPGIGAVKAQAIIDYREANGPFTSIEQIQNVTGIGPATYEKIKDLITVGD